MISIHKKLFYETFDKNIDLYIEFINIIKEEYINFIKNIVNATSVKELRRNIHSLIGIISVFETNLKNELLYFCKFALNEDKNDTSNVLEKYQPYIKQIVEFDKTKLGL